MRQFRDATDLTEGVAWLMSAKRVTWRRCGKNGEARRPMVHRFEVAGGATLIDVMAANITRNSSLLSRLHSARACRE